MSLIFSHETFVVFNLGIPSQKRNNIQTHLYLQDIYYTYGR